MRAWMDLRLCISVVYILRCDQGDLKWLLLQVEVAEGPCHAEDSVQTAVLHLLPRRQSSVTRSAIVSEPSDTSMIKDQGEHGGRERR